jgi:hypothetical protein
VEIDPLGFEAGDANLLRYEGNNPRNYLDPTGLQAIAPPQGPGSTVRPSCPLVRNPAHRDPRSMTSEEIARALEQERKRKDYRDLLEWAKGVARAAGVPEQEIQTIIGPRITRKGSEYDPAEELIKRAKAVKAAAEMEEWLQRQKTRVSAGASQEPPEQRSCAKTYPAEINCLELRDLGYKYKTETEALNALRRQKNRPHANVAKRDVTTGGPCPGRGEHLNIRDKQGCVASIVSCPCCEDLPDGPKLRNLYKII